MVEYSKLFVVLFGIGVVFFGLVCIVALTLIMGKIMGVHKPAAPAAAPAAAPTRAPAPAAAPAAAPAPVAGIAPEIVAVITAALSEDPNISSRGVHITSIKKLS